MRAKELSYRRRRRLVALTVVAVLVGAIAAAIILLPTGDKVDRGATPLPPGAGAGPEATPTQPAPHPMHLSADDRRQLKTTIALFVTTSVARHHPERSWAIVDPAFRQGLTRSQWSAGNIPVVPYPAVGVDLLTLESAADEKALVEVLLEPPRKSHLVRKTFQIELHRLPSSSAHRWLISSWVPEGVSDSQRDADARFQPESAAVASSHTSHLSTTWIFVPVALLLGGMILVPAGLFFRESYQYRRAKAEFQRPREELRR